MIPRNSVMTVALILVVALQPHASVGRALVAVSDGVALTPAASGLHLPVIFERNQGQAGSDVLFVGRFGGVTALLTISAVTFFGQAADIEDSAGTSSSKDSGINLAHVAVASVGSDPSTTRVVGEAPLTSVSHYFIGSDPQRWHRNVAHYQRVRYVNLADGSELVIDSERGRPRLTRVNHSGLATDLPKLEWRAGGDMVTERPSAPELVHLERASCGTRESALSPQAISTTLDFSTYFGGSGGDIGSEVGTTSAGHIVVAGRTQSVDLPLLDPWQSTFGGPEVDGFVARFDGDSHELAFATYIGGTDRDLILGLDIDAQDRIVIAGYSASANFPTVQPFQANLAGVSDVFLSRFSSSGTVLELSSFLGGSNFDYCDDVTVTTSGKFVVSGFTQSTDFPVVAPVSSSLQGADDAWCAVISADFAGPEFSTYFGGSGNEIAYGHDTAPDGSILLAGYTNSADFPGIPVTAPRGTPPTDAFVARIDPSSSALIWSTRIGGALRDEFWDVLVSADGEVIAVGLTFSNNLNVVGAFQSQFGGGSDDGMLARLGLEDGSVTYLSYFGGSGADLIAAVSTDEIGNIVLCGSTTSVNFAQVNPVQTGLAGDADAFVARFDGSGQALSFSTYFGGASTENGERVMLAGGRIFLVGNTMSDDLPLVGATQGTRAGAFDTFVAVFTFGQLAGSDTAGIFVPDTGAWFLRNANSPGSADAVFTFGPANGGWVPLRGDWDGDGRDTPGIYNPLSGVFFLRNSNTPGPASVAFGYGPAAPGWVAVAGDWNGDGLDSVGLYDPSTGFFFLKNANTPGSANLVYGFGPTGGMVPLSGDWNGDGIDTVGLYSPGSGVVFMRNTHAPGPADLAYGFGPAGQGWSPIVGDFDGDGMDTLGLYSPVTGTFYLRNVHAPGPADLVFGYGPANATPLSGNWDGQ